VAVGVFVLVVAALLLATVVAVSGAFSHSGVEHRSYFKFAGGIEPGAAVRYGGMKAGRVEKVKVDPHDSTRIEIDFQVRSEIPVKTDSQAKISSLGALGDNYVEVTTGSAGSPLAPAGSELKSGAVVTFDDLIGNLNSLAPLAQKTLVNLNDRITELQPTLQRVNDLLNDHNRAAIASTLDNLNGMVRENRSKVSVTLTNLQATSERIRPLLDDFSKTLAQANVALGHIDATVMESRPELRAALLQLRQTLDTTSSIVNQLSGTLEYNTPNIDQILENVRLTTENLRQLTDQLKSQPSILIRGVKVRERSPGDAE
jgi:phospholipid/cholesterol/gamma-HCH transport system substrate-binding protein